MPVFTQCPLGRLLPLALLLAPAQAWAQSQADPPAAAADDEIVVTAPELKRSQIWRQARQITSQTAIRDQPLERFERPVCPGVVGVRPDLAAWMVWRIRHNAQRIGLDTATNGDCRVNILLAFVADGKAEIDRLMQRHYFDTSSLELWEIKALQAEAGPVRAWSFTSLRGRDGALASGGSGGGTAMINATSASRILLNIRRDIEISVVLVDIPAADGMAADQIADYASMRAFARTHVPESSPTYGTILTLFDKGGERANGMTAFDVAYLKSIYEGNASVPTISKIARVTKAMRDEVARDKSEEARDQ